MSRTDVLRYRLSVNTKTKPMELKIILPQNLKSGPVSEITTGVIWYVYTGRNAWHRTWGTYYGKGCMHTTLDSAKAYAERRRTKGSSFYIDLLPCMVFRSKESLLVITEISASNPLSGYSCNATTKDVPYGGEKIEGALDNYLHIGAPIEGIALSFLPDSRFWNVRPANPVIFLTHQTPSTEIEKIRLDTLSTLKSASFGGGYYLTWTKRSKAEIKNSAVLELFRKAKINA